MKYPVQIVCIFLLLFTASTSHSGEKPDATNYDIKLTILPDIDSFETRHDLDGIAVIDMVNPHDTALDTLDFYLFPEIRILSVTGNDGESIEFTTELVDTFMSTAHCIKAVHVLQSLASKTSTQLTIAFEGWILPSGIRAASFPNGGFSDTYAGIQKEFTFLRSLGYTPWFPMTDYEPGGLNEKADFQLELNIPDIYTPLAFGARLSETDKNERNITRWRTQMPISLGEVDIMLDTFDRIIDEGGFRLMYHEKSDVGDSIKIYAKVGKELRAYFKEHYSAGFSRDFIEAPFILAEIQLPAGVFTGQNILGLSGNNFNSVATGDTGERYSKLRWLGHEMVTEWVRTALDTEAKGQVVVADGLMLYLQLPCLWEVLGEDFETWDLNDRWLNYEMGLAEGRNHRSRKLPPEIPLADITLKTYPPYKDIWLTADKLQIVLHRLQRHVVGDDVFMSAVSKYLGDHREKPATLDSFRVYLEGESGLDLSEFFNTWFYTTELLPDEWKLQ